MDPRFARAARITPRALFLAALIAACAAGCGGPRRSFGPDDRAGAPCSLLPGTPRPGAVLTVLLLEAVDPRHAPRPWNDAEAMVFRLEHETLTEVGCDGRPMPALAASWEPADDGSWRFRLRPAARLPRGAETASFPRVPRRTDVTLAIEEALDAGGPTTIVVRPDRARDDVAFLVADPTFALVPPRPERPLLALARVGSGGRWTGDDGTGPGAASWEPAPGRPGALVARIDFRLAPGADPRDVALDDVDAFVLRARDHVRWFARDEGFRLVPLPWGPTYWLVTADDDVARRATEDAVADMAARVTLSEARPARDVSWLHVGAAASDAARRAVLPARPLPRVVVPAGDADARALAERLAALAGPLRALVVAELPPARFLRSLASGDATAWILPQRHRSPRPPIVREELLAAAPWLPVAGGWAIPLVETRAVLAARRDIAGIDAAADGVPRLERAGRTPEGALP